MRRLASIILVALLGVAAVGVLGCIEEEETVMSTPKQTPAETPDNGIITDLAYIKAIASGYSDDADPQYEGVEVSILWYDSESEWIRFRDIPVRVTIQLFTTDLNPDTWEWEVERYVYEGEAEIHNSTSDIRIPFEQIDANPHVDDKYGHGTIIVHTPEQGDFSGKIGGIFPLYETE